MEDWFDLELILAVQV